MWNLNSSYYVMTLIILDTTLDGTYEEGLKVILADLMDVGYGSSSPYRLEIKVTTPSLKEIVIQAFFATSLPTSEVVKRADWIGRYLNTSRKGEYFFRVDKLPTEQLH